MQTNSDPLAPKTPRPAFEGVEERREFLEKRRPHLEHPGRDYRN
jgi:hypothetical protein